MVMSVGTESHREVIDTSLHLKDLWLSVEDFEWWSERAGGSVVGCDYS